MVAAAPAGGVFVGGLAVYGVGLGIVDATSNMQAVAVEHRYGRPILPSFHGAWTFGGILGACYALAAAHLPLWTAGLVAVVPLVALAAPYLPREHGEALTAAEQVAVPWRPILLVGLGMVLFYMVDTAAQTWGPTYLDDSRRAQHPRRAGHAALPGRQPRAPARRATGWWRGTARCRSCAPARWWPRWPCSWWSPRRPGRSPSWASRCSGAGVSVIAPLSFSAAARIAGGEQARVDAVIARFNQFNYVGGLLGAVLTGLVGAGSLRLGFAVPMVLILAMLPLARAFAPAGRVTVAAE